MFKSTISIFLSILFLLLTSTVCAEVWSATSVAWLSTGDDGKFINPRVICTKDEFLGTAWEERHQDWSRAGVTLYGQGQWYVYPLPAVKKIQGIASAVNEADYPVVAYGSPSGLHLGVLQEDKWKVTTICSDSCTLFDLVYSRSGLTLLYAKGKAAYFAKESEDGWLESKIELPLSPTHIGPARMAIVDGRPTACIKITSDEDEFLYQAKLLVGGWVVEALPRHLATMVNEGRFGLAYTPNDGLQIAFMRQDDKALVLANLSKDNCPIEEPDPGCALRFPQVDLTFTHQGKPNVIYFVITPDGGLQIRIARLDEHGRWFSMMIDRTMSKNSLASCSLGLHQGEAPFLSYALGPARAVLLAYPKSWAPPGIGL